MSPESALLNCRLCQAHKGTIEISNDQEFVKKLFECTHIKVNDADAEKLPKSVCNECNTNINFIYDYFGKVKANDAKLRAMLLSEKSQKFECPECKKTYIKYANFQMHKKSHSSLFCFSCEVIFDDTSDRHEHSCSNLTHVEPREDNYDESATLKSDSLELEENCGDRAIVRGEPLQLRSEEEGKNLEGFVCKICQEIFVLRIDFWLHKKVHKSTFTCSWENCGKICSTSHSLKRHEMKHEGKKRFLCVTCGKAFLTKNSLNCHEKIHLEVKGYLCKICNIGFSVKSNLRAHEKKHHEGVRFYCSQCTRTFITKCSLDRHERIHTGIKEYQCQNCPSAFYTSKELQKHQRYHQGLRQHKCEQCFKTFFERHHLKVHLRSHTGERPYVCKIADCNKSFAESQKLSRHVKAKHSC